MANNAYSVSETQIGLGVETVRGSAQPASVWIPVKAPKYKPDQTTIPDDTLQGSMVAVYNLTPGMRYDSHGWDSYVYTDASEALLLGEFGYGAGGVYSLLNNLDGTGNQPPSLTLYDFDGEETRIITAAQVDELSFKGNGTGYVDYTCTFFGNPATTSPGPPSPSASFLSARPVPGWNAEISIAGTPLNYVLDWSFDFKRGVKPIPALTGTRAYFMYFAGPLQATGKLTVVEQSGAPELVQYLSGTQESFDFTLSSYTSGGSINFHSTKAEFTTGELDRSKVEEVEAVLDFTCLPTTTDATAGGVSPCLITVVTGSSA